MSIYTKHGKRLLNDTIRIDGECYAGNKLIQVRALVEGASVPQLFYLSDLVADEGRKEIDQVIKANRKAK